MVLEWQYERSYIIDRSKRNHTLIGIIHSLIYQRRINDRNKALGQNIVKLPPTFMSKIFRKIASLVQIYEHHVLGHHSV